MGKVVYNACYGGFGLSRAATERLAAMGVEDAAKRLAEPDDDGSFWYSARFVPRHDPRLVRVVEEMGAAANGQCADLRVKDVFGADAYKIVDNDGNERVEEVYCDGVTFAPSADDMAERFKAAEAHAAKLDREAAVKRGNGFATQAQRFIGRAEGIRECLAMLRKTGEGPEQAEDALRGL